MTDRAQELADRLAQVRTRIERACTEAGRSSEEVTLVVVTKFFPATDVMHLVQLGVTDIGENRHQEAAAKLAELDPQVRAAVQAHFIGQLQSNKAGAVAGYADVVQSVDRAKVARALARASSERETPLRVTLQVDLQGTDAGRGGVRPADLPALADEVAAADGLDLCGLWPSRRSVMSPRPPSLDWRSCTPTCSGTTRRRPGCRPA